MRELNKKGLYILSGIYILLVITLMIILGVNGGKLDLEFSKLVAACKPGVRYTKNIFAIIIEISMSFVTYLLISFGLHLLIKSTKDFKNQKLGLAIKIISYVLSIGCLVVGTHQTVGYFVDNGLLPSKWDHLLNISLVFKIGCSVLLNGLLLLICKYIDMDSKNLFRLALIIIIACVIPTFIINVVIKPIHARCRYRAMMLLDNGSYEYFTSWVKTGVKRMDLNLAIKDDFKSFPSGHTSSATLIFVICLIPYFYEKANKKSYIFTAYLISAIITVVTAFYRVRGGAHYLSDVTMGSFLSILSIILVFFIEYIIASKKPTLYDKLF